jgi:hypothetical protein
MGNLWDCKLCNNRGTFYGCRKCGRKLPPNYVADYVSHPLDNLSPNPEYPLSGQVAR